MIITEAFPQDAGCYKVTAKNECGEASVSCTVSVKGPLPHETSDSDLVSSDMEPIVPKFQLSLRDLKIQEGHSARLDCVIVGQPEPEVSVDFLRCLNQLKHSDAPTIIAVIATENSPRALWHSSNNFAISQVIWYHDEQPVKESSDFQLLFQGDRCSLVIHEAFLDDAGTYRVVAINSGGEASSQCTLTVTRTCNLLSSRLDDRGRLVNITVYVDVTLFCRFTAVSHPDVTDRAQEGEETLASGFAPKFVRLPTDLLVAEGEDAIFECAVTGEPKPDLRWYSTDDGEVVHDGRIIVCSLFDV